MWAMSIAVVDENDNILRFKDREDRNPNDRIRISVLWLLNSKNEALISQRALTKANSPGKWTASVSGTVEDNETYLETMIRETQEELGINIEEREVLWSVKKSIDRYRKYFGTVFFVKRDLEISKFKLQKEEVEQVRWISVNEVSEWYKQKPRDFTLAFVGAHQSLLEFIKRQVI